MAVCVGCGLEVNNGILEVNVCGDPIVPNITTGGLQCDPATEDGCLKVVLNDSHAGCGLTASQGQLAADPCVSGGILCGDITGPADTQCIYVNVQGQENGPCITITGSNTGGPGNCVITECSAQNDNCIGLSNTANTGFVPTCPSPNCNGLVRTCDGLWAPPALPSINFPCGQRAATGNSIDSLLYPLGPQSTRVSAPADGFPFASNDLAWGFPNASSIIFVNAFDPGDNCVPIDAMSWTAFTSTFTVEGGEVWRVLLHERICISATSLTAPCTGGWALQSAGYIDNRGQDTRVASIQINDNSTWRFAAGDRGRMEAMITYQRVVGGPTAQAENPHQYSDFQYRNMGTGFHHRVNQNCGFRSTGDTLA